MDALTALAVAFLQLFVVVLLTGCIVACGKRLLSRRQKQTASIALPVAGLFLCSLLFVFLWFVLGWGH